MQWSDYGPSSPTQDTGPAGFAEKSGRLGWINQRQGIAITWAKEIHSEAAVDGMCLPEKPAVVGGIATLGSLVVIGALIGAMMIAFCIFAGPHDPNNMTVPEMIIISITMLLGIFCMDTPLMIADYLRDL